jgi:hypothetical protein
MYTVNLSSNQQHTSYTTDKMLSPPAPFENLSMKESREKLAIIEDCVLLLAQHHALSWVGQQKGVNQYVLQKRPSLTTVTSR